MSGENPCGSCTLCCKLLGIPELGKPACSWCPRAIPGSGCGAYEDRPSSCREFACIWLQSQRRPGAVMPPELRPDRCGAVLATGGEGSGIPLVLHIDPHRPETHRKGGLARLIARVVADGQPVGIVTGSRQQIMRPRPR